MCVSKFLVDRDLGRWVIMFYCWGCCCIFWVCVFVGLGVVCVCCSGFILVGVSECGFGLILFKRCYSGGIVLDLYWCFIVIEVYCFIGWFDGFMDVFIFGGMMKVW